MTPNEKNLMATRRGGSPAIIGHVCSTDKARKNFDAINWNSKQSSNVHHKSDKKQAKKK